MTQVSEDAVRIARWRCATVHRIPPDLIDDFLHDAIVIALESRLEDESRIANWLSLVAYRRFLTDKYRLSTRKTRQFPVLHDERGNEKEIDMPDHGPDPSGRSVREEEIEQATRELAAIARLLTPMEAEAFDLLGRVGTGSKVGRSLGRTSQAISMRLTKVKRKARENKSGDSHD